MWQKLRDEHPGKYENAVNPVPDPNGWFHAGVVVASQLSERRKGLTGLWVDSSGGDLANFKIVPA